MSKIELFTPAFASPVKDGLSSDLRRFFGAAQAYEATRGRWAFYHILRLLGVSGKVLLPAYLCSSVLQATDKLKLSVGYYDQDPVDLNPSISSLERELTRQKPEAVLFPSMYGNPADLQGAQKLCRQHGSRLVDDAAQSAGARLNGQYIGTFGDAGFIAFSPGKPMPAAMGAYWWCTPPHKQPVLRAGQAWQHFIVWAAWEAHRLNAYLPDFRRWGGVLKVVEKIVTRFDDMSLQTLCDFERDRLAGYLRSLLDGKFDFRIKMQASLRSEVEAAPGWSIVDAVRGDPHPHKFVIVAPNVGQAGKLLSHLADMQIAALPGYRLLCDDPKVVPSALSLAGRIVELPIEADLPRMTYLRVALHTFFRQRHDS